MIWVKEINGVRVISPSGELTISYGANELSEKLEEAVKEGCEKVVIDLAEVSYIDSFAVSIIVRYAVKLASIGRYRMRVCGAKDGVLYTLRFERIDSIVDIHETLEDALRSFG